MQVGPSNILPDFFFFFGVPLIFEVDATFPEKNSSMKKPHQAVDFFNIPAVIPGILNRIMLILMQVPSFSSAPKRAFSVKRAEEMKLYFSVSIHTLNSPLAGEEGTGLLRTLTAKVLH